MSKPERDSLSVLNQRAPLFTSTFIPVQNQSYLFLCLVFYRKPILVQLWLEALSKPFLQVQPMVCPARQPPQSERNGVRNTK